MKKIKPILLIFLSLIIYAYVCSVMFIPNRIILFQGENLGINTLLGISIESNRNNQIIFGESNYEVMQTSTATTENSLKIGNTNITLNLFGKIPLRQIDVNIIPRTKVIPLGKSIGLRLYTQGVLVVGMSEIKGQDNMKYRPYENSGIEEGDTIVAINNKEVYNTQELINKVNESNGEKLIIKYIKEDNPNSIMASITPVKIADNEYKLGLWVRDAAEGVGTATFYEPSTGEFAALGHPITDIDTGNIINIAKGDLVTSEILSIIKGDKGNPGEIRGIISKGMKIGELVKNTNFGIFGKLSTIFSNIQSSSHSKEMDVALRNEIKLGKAYILCELENGKIEKYEIQIQKIYLGNNYDNKSMLIKVTDKKLIQKTGGIVQGMSGSPIIQNDKFVGAVTHVLVSDPTQGYAVFGDLMIKEMRAIF